MEKLHIFWILISIMISFCQLSAQDTIWVRQYDSGFDDYAYDVALDRFGNIIIVGATGDVMSGQAQMLLVKYDSLGNQLWSGAFSSGNFDVGFGVAVDSSCNIIVAGCYGDSGPAGCQVVKFNAAGDILWLRHILPGEGNHLFGVVIDSANNVISAGGYATTGDALLVKYDQYGDSLWIKTYDLGAYEDLYRVSVDSSGNIIATGAFSTAGCFDFLTMKYDENGDTIWTRQFDFNDFDESRDVTIGALNDIFVTGTTSEDYVDFDLMTVRLTADGDTVWTRQDNRSSYDEAFGIRPNGLGHLVICGVIAGSNGGDYLLTTYDGQGQEIWTTTYDGGQDDAATALEIEPSGNIVVAGSSFSGSNYDIITIKYHPQQGIVSRDAKFVIDTDFDIEVASPSNRLTRLCLIVRQPGNYIVTLIDCLGRRVVDIIYHGYLTKGEYHLPLTLDASGIYFLRAENGQSARCTKLISLE